uniref:Uncharacterized protein n=1 Tax=Arundo donax TaxID=35708 RepID=A0A0A8ZJ04_ARUDO
MGGVSIIARLKRRPREACRTSDEGCEMVGRREPLAAGNGKTTGG